MLCVYVIRVCVCVLVFFCNVEEVPELLSLRIEREGVGWVGERERECLLLRKRNVPKDQIFCFIGERSNFREKV